MQTTLTKAPESKQIEQKYYTETTTICNYVCNMYVISLPDHISTFYISIYMYTGVDIGLIDA